MCRNTYLGSLPTLKSLELPFFGKVLPRVKIVPHAILIFFGSSRLPHLQPLPSTLHTDLLTLALQIKDPKLVMTLLRSMRKWGTYLSALDDLDSAHHCILQNRIKHKGLEDGGFSALLRNRLHFPQEVRDFFVPLSGIGLKRLLQPNCTWRTSDGM